MKKLKIMLTIGLITAVVGIGAMGATKNINSDMNNKSVVLLSQSNTPGNWIKDYGNWYYNNNEGQPYAGWIINNGSWYYMNPNNFALTTGWQEVNGQWYYMNTSGQMTTGWQEVNGQWYYMNTSGQMTTGWQEVNGQWYYMNSSGQMTTGWQEVNGSWYYMNSSGVMQSNRELWVNNQMYSFAPSGAMQTGWIKGYPNYRFNPKTEGEEVIGTEWLYANSSGALEMNQWVQDGQNWYYMGSYGQMLEDITQEINGNYYAFNSNGVMQTQDATINGNKYDIASNGVIQLGWKEINGSWYYYNDNTKNTVGTCDGQYVPVVPMGAMQIGWINDNGSFYYLNKDGVMQTGKTYINGITYDLSNSGALTSKVSKINGYNKYMSLYNQAVKESEGPSDALKSAQSQGQMDIDSYNQFKTFDNLYNELNTYLKDNLSQESLQVYNADTSSWMQNENAKATLLESGGGSIVPLLVNSQLASDYQVKCKEIIQNYMK
ncbi:MAG: hypothetical protein ACRDCW_00015 [Sarcina sp.]